MSEPLKTWRDIELRALDCPVLHRVVMSVRHGKASQLDALIAAALWFSEDRERLIADMIQLRAVGPAPIIFAKP